MLFEEKVMIIANRFLCFQGKHILCKEIDENNIKVIN
jgi:hypothetical protein